MNSFKFCPNCENYPTLRMNRTKINIKCKCGYDQVINIKDYLNQLKKCNSHLCIEKSKLIENYSMKDHFLLYILKNFSRRFTTKSFILSILDRITYEINREYTHLLKDFKYIKNNLMNKMIKQLNDLESSYERCVTENTDIFCLLKILIDNYNDSKEMESNIVLKSNIQYRYCKNKNNVDDVINYYKTYSII